MTLYKQNNLSYTPAKFAEAVAHLTLRYSEGYTHDPKHTIKWQDQISIPPKNYSLLDSKPRTHTRTLCLTPKHRPIIC